MPANASLPPLSLEDLAVDGPSADSRRALPEPAPAAGRSQAPSRSFADVAAARAAIYDSVLKAAAELQPLRNRLHTLELADVHYIDPPEFSIADRKRAILEGGTLSRRLRGTWVLRDNATGKELDRKTMTIAHVPHLTDAGTFVLRGTEIGLTNQLRLRPGIFTRTRANGEVEAHVNLLPGRGRSHRYYLDPASGVYYIEVGQAKIPLMPLVRALGATDQQLRQAWGDKIFEANLAMDRPQALKKLSDQFLARAKSSAGAGAGEGPNTAADAAEQLRRLFAEEMAVDPEVTKRTLGAPYKNLGLDTVLAATKKLLAVSRGEAETDDRDHLAFQKVFGPEDLLAERIANDYGGERRKAFYRASFSRSLKHIPIGLLTRQLEALFRNSGLAISLEEINPAELLDKLTRVTRLGEGSIASVDAVPQEARSVQPSHLGFIDPLRTPENLRIGVDLYLSRGARKGADGQLYAQLRDVKSGKLVWKTPQEIADLAIAFPGEMRRPGKFAAALVGGRMRYVPKAAVALELPHYEDAMSPLGNLVPMKSAVKGQRAVMGARMITQAVPLVAPEAPLVQSGVPEQPETSFEELYAPVMGALRAEKPGVVRKVSEDAIHISYDDGTRGVLELHRYTPHARKTFLHQTPVVRPGDRVAAGDLLARSNYTDERGVTALGVNARVAYMPWRGLNFEDAAVISQSMANRLTSEHAYQHTLSWDDEYKLGKRNFVALFPSKFTRSQLGNLDENGIVRPGATLNYGDPLILAARPNEVAPFRVHRRGTRSYSDASVVWEKHSPGVVTDVAIGKDFATVVVRTQSPTETGDKIAGRYGDKSIVTVLPDDQMPVLSDGKPADVVLNPLGIISRGNPAQLIEAALGKIAAKTGRPYKIRDFEDIEDLTEFALNELKKHGLGDDILEDVYDPSTGRKIRNVPVGNRFIMKLHHMAEAKGQARSVGGYTAFEEPAKGGSAGSKRVALLELSGLLSHSVPGVLKDISLIKGQKNDEFWLSFMSGNTPQQPKVPLVFERFVNDLRAAGVNVVPDGPSLHLMAMTDRDVERLAEDREITNSDLVKLDEDLTPIPGGFFDPALTGGPGGRRWSFIRLAVPLLNPVMEEPARRLLGLTADEFEQVIAGRKRIETGTGPEAIRDALAAIDLDKEIAKARQLVQSGKRAARDQATRKLGYLLSAKRLGIHPKEWVLTKVPVLPPIFRPISRMSATGAPLVTDANYLYKELFEANANLKALREATSNTGEEQLALYKALRAVTGLGDPLHPKLVEKGVSGLLKSIFGDSPKFSQLQRRLLTSATDLVGRATIAPDPDLDMDHIGLPENRAWEVYRPFIIRRLRRRGMPLLQAAQHFEQRTPLARAELIEEMQQRPVIVSRAPVLHRFGVMAFWPKLVKGEVLKLSPLVYGGFAADNDGDQMNYSVPVSDEAVRQAAERMLPSRNLLSPADFSTPMHKPSQEYVLGLYLASTMQPREAASPAYFADRKSAIAAFLRGELPPDAIVDVPAAAGGGGRR